MPETNPLNTLRQRAERLKKRGHPDLPSTKTPLANGEGDAVVTVNHHGTVSVRFGDRYVNTENPDKDMAPIRAHGITYRGRAFAHRDGDEWEVPPEDTHVTRENGDAPTRAGKDHVRDVIRRTVEQWASTPEAETLFATADERAQIRKEYIAATQVLHALDEDLGDKAETVLNADLEA